MSILQRFITCTTIRNGLTIKPLQFVSRLSVSTKNLDKKESKQELLNPETNKPNWTVVYRLPMIRWASAFNRLKVYQTVVTAVGIPAAFVLEQAELLSNGGSVVVGAVGVSGIITLSLCSLVVKNLIGFIYINRETNQLKFAYVDYWGKRQDILVDINDVVPDGAQDKPTRSNFYQRIGLQSNEKITFKLLQRYGIIVQPDVFGSLFY